jgi:hypothetical protein
MTIRMVVSDGAASDLPTPSRHSGHSAQQGNEPETGGSAPAPSGAAYLRARARHAAEQHHVPEFEPIRRAVARWVREERIERRATVVTMYHLVPRGSAAAYRKALDRAAAAHGVRLIVTGPHLPFAFTTSEMDLHG